MNRQSIAKRIEQAAEQSRVKDKGTVIKCWLSDGSIENMDLLTAINYNRGKLVDNEVVYQEPHIIRVECISGAERAPELVSVLEQMINYADKRRDKESAAKGSRAE